MWAPEDMCSFTTEISQLLSAFHGQIWLTFNFTSLMQLITIFSSLKTPTTNMWAFSCRSSGKWGNAHSSKHWQSLLNNHINPKTLSTRVSKCSSFNLQLVMQVFQLLLLALPPIRSRKREFVLTIISTPILTISLSESPSKASRKRKSSIISLLRHLLTARSLSILQSTLR